MNDNLKSLIKYYCDNSLPSPDEQKMEETIKCARNSMNITSDVDVEYDLTPFEFFVSQLTFVRWYIWGVQFMSLLISAIILFNSYEVTATIGIISVITPMMILSWVRELSRAFTFQSAEMELCTRYTLRHAILSRIIIVGLTDVLFLSLISLGIVQRFHVFFPHVFMYLAVPVLLVSFGCLLILNKVPSGAAEYVCIAWCGAAMLIFLYLSKMEPLLYEGALIGGWYTALVVSLSFVLFECYILLKKCCRDICLQ